MGEDEGSESEGVFSKIGKMFGGKESDEDYLKTLGEQYKYGYISKAAYDEARGSA